MSFFVLIELEIGIFDGHNPVWVEGLVVKTDGYSTEGPEFDLTRDVEFFSTSVG